MKRLFALAIFLGGLPGCASNDTSTPQPSSSNQVTLQATPPAAAPAKLTPSQELSKFCRVCVVDRGERMEEFLPSRLDAVFEGNTYKFCTENCRKRFDADKRRYALKGSMKS